jgi:hypothetical protein
MSTERQDCFVCGNDDDTLFDVISVGEEGDDVILLRHCLLCNDVTYVEPKNQSRSEVDILNYLTDSTPLR